MSYNNAKNILVGASPLFISEKDSTQSGYGVQEPGTAASAAYAPGVSYTTTLNGLDGSKYRNVGYTNNGLQITYNPTYDSVTVDQLLDTAKLFKSAMEVMIATEMSEGTLENILVVFGQAGAPVTAGSTTTETKTIGLEAGALGIAPTERQLIAVGAAPTADATATERIYYARRVLSVQQSQFSLARTTATTFPVTFRLLPDAAYAGAEYGKIIDRVLTV
jgi:hypothetical protein